MNICGLFIKFFFNRELQLIKIPQLHAATINCKLNLQTQVNGCLESIFIMTFKGHLGMPRFVIEVLDLSIGSCFFPYAIGEIMDYLNWCKSELIKGRILDIIFFENSGHSWLRQLTF